MRKFLCVISLATLSATGWFFWPRIASEFETRLPEVLEKRAELNNLAPKNSLEALPTDEVDPNPEPKGVIETETLPCEVPSRAPIEAPAEVPTAKSSSSLETGPQLWF